VLAQGQLVGQVQVRAEVLAEWSAQARVSVLD